MTFLKLVLMLFMIIFANALANDGDFVNTNVFRQIDLQTPLEKVHINLTVKNVASESKDFFMFHVEHDLAHYVAFTDEKRQKMSYLSHGTYSELDRHPTRIYTVYFNVALKPRESLNIKVEIMHGYSIVPLYKSKKINDDQMLIYKGNMYFYSPYVTSVLETEFVATNINDTSLTQAQKDAMNNLRFLRFLYHDVAPYSFEEIQIMIKNNNPLLMVTDLYRIIDVSHFGMITIEDRITLKNTGSQLVGPYEPNLKEELKAATKWLFTRIPIGAHRIQYFDGLGNSSKSRVLDYSQYKLIKFQLRYPLYGGWKIPYVLKYSLPSYHYLETDNNGHFRLQMKVIDHILDNCIIEHAQTKVFIPDGVKISNIYIPPNFQGAFNEQKPETMCIFSKSEIVFYGSAIYEEHNSDFQIDYSFCNIYLLKIPIAISLILETIFLVIIVVNRLDFSLK